MSDGISIIPLRGIPLVQAGDDLAALIAQAARADGCATS